MAAYDPSGPPDMGAEDSKQHGEYEYNPEDAGDEDDDYDPSSFSFGDNTAQQDTAMQDQTQQSATARQRRPPQSKQANRRRSAAS